MNLLFHNTSNKAVLMQITKNGEVKNTTLPSLPHRYALMLFALILVSLGLSLKAQPSMVRLQMSGPNNALDETVLYYQNGATLGFDSEYDAYKLSGPNPHAEIGIYYDATLFQINGIERVNQFVSLPVLAKAPVTGTYTIFATDFQNMPFGTCIKLIDTETGSATDIRNTNYTFTLSNTTNTPRFSLEISFSVLPVITSVTPPICTNSTGTCIAEGLGSGPWTYTWKDTSGNIIRTAFEVSGPDSVNAVAGAYVVNITSGSGCNYGSADFTINNPEIVPVAAFTSSDTVFLEYGGILNTQNTSLNAASYEWYFSDNGTSSTDINSYHEYADEGDFEVSLFAYNLQGCSDTTVKIIHVSKTDPTPAAVGLESAATVELKWCTLGSKQYMVANSQKDLIDIHISDLGGKTLVEKQSNEENIHLNLESFQKGLYIVSLKTKKGIKRIQFFLE